MGPRIIGGIVRALIVLSLTLAATGASRAQPGPVPAFPGAEGFGRWSLGGRGGQVFHVTNLEDAGPGSLRDAVEARGPRTVVFDIAGTIRLKTPLKIKHPRITIAGQTAPGEGITLRDQPLVIAADDVVIRYIRSRLGDESKIQDDAITVTSGRRIVLDHLSASWSVDETLSLGSRYAPPEDGFYDVTVQWSVIAESLNRSVHAKGRHGYGSLIRGGYGAKISFHHNLWASHVNRMPRPGNYNPVSVDPLGPLIDFRNNVFYNWGGETSGYNADKDTAAAYNFVGNWYVQGPDSPGALAFCEHSQAARAFFQGNAMNGIIPADPWSLVTCEPPAGYRSAGPVVDPEMPTDTARIAYDRVMSLAGVSLRRDSVDLRILTGVKARTGRLIDTQAQVGGWPVLASGPAPKDSDGDGMPDAWEKAHGLNPTNPADGATDRDGDGYTHLEAYLNSLV
ncbi:hypothetical protein QO010_000085 [Caulobacter ginsengisoli]|uniref:Pectate lyase n=1 Tax=Caulobacter ginsengisoli TaxID=400775 RepID=A0ABU0IK23_9CAUL|nr:pectate lyase [Caulobacter ginsengisoli]MDQ0462337.1 hypothetical protein [Caulobacter ginsengisoli]